MDARELRIGNKVYLYGSIATIEPVDFYGIGIAIKKGKPILLTEEWLLKFGFSENENDVLQIETTLMPLSITLSDNYPDEKYKAWVYEDEKSRYHIISNNIKHVHQLQNLYHALTNEELTLTK